MLPRRCAVLLCVICSAFFGSKSAAQTKLLRFPDIHDNEVVFTYGGDLWTAPVSGGTAIRLTSHPGIEVFAKFSPDGKWIAFTGQYDGDEQVYVMPAGGGVPKQLTFYPARGPLTPRWGYDNQVYGWSNDGRYVIFRSLRDSYDLPITRLYRVSVEGGPAEPLPMPESGAGTFSPDGKKMVYSPRSRDFRTEKRYSGGQANQLYIFDLESYETKKITDSERASRDPMWIGDKIFFDSDRDGHFNLYAYDVPAGKATQVTFEKTWDIRWPSSDRKGRIIYEQDGELHIFDVASGKAQKISITVPDDGVGSRPSHISAANWIESAALSPKGERVVFSARGDIFSAPVEKGATRNLTKSSGAHDKAPSWSPDGSKIAYISDRTGEEEIYVEPQDGSGSAEQVTQGGKAMRYDPDWSPDGKQIAFSDKDGRLFVVTLADKKLTEVAHSKLGEIRDNNWSPRGNYLAFSMPQENGFSSIYVWSQRDGQLRRVTDPMFDAREPAWDPEGNCLFYLSDREFAPQISNIEFDFATNRSTGIFAVALRKDVKNPFPPESDEVTITKEGDKDKKDEKKEEKDKKEVKKDDKDKDQDKNKDLVIDFDGLGARVARVPVEAANYRGLSVKSGHLIYVSAPAFYYGRQGDSQPALKVFAFKDRKETTLAEDMQGYSLSRDGSKVLAHQGQAWNVYEATPTGASTKKTVPTTGLSVDRVPAEEWAQIFDEVWRRYRDFFYVPNMHGYDWEAVRNQYRPLLKDVADRTDLNYVISEMIAELTVQHAYIDGGDIPIPPRARVALPGARFKLDPASNRYQISKIFEGENEEELYRSPLTEIGVDAKAGDYVLAINGAEVTGKEDIYKFLRNAADSPVELTLNAKPSLDGSRKVSYKPITDESNLIYLDWVNHNREKVSQMTDGRIGYIHVPDMGASGIREFIKWYFPQIRKEGMIVDVRANGGGNVSRMLIERMRRELLGMQYARNIEQGFTYPDQVFIGPMVAILNENSASDGDIFPAMFRQAGIGPLIGKRSWGGVVGITDHGQLIDGGHVSVPEFGFTNAKGEWIIEGHGVDPDIEVDNDPKSVIAGRDLQLERAVAEVLKRTKDKPAKLPEHAPAPVKLK
jgi:tricorn protease